MARSNSPGYPSMALPKAIAAVRKMFEADRRNPIDRVTAAKHIGYSGQSGASDKALGSLAHYGLVEKTGKGELRVTQLAVDIIHPDPTKQGSEANALWHAGMNPQVFKELRARFPDHVSESSLRSYLIREGFNNVAVSPLMNAFFETFRFLEQYKDFESGGIGSAEGGESDPSDDNGTDEMNDTATIERPATAPQTKPVTTPAPDIPSVLNRPRMDIQGDKVRLDALLDLNGLIDLEKKLPALKMLLQVYQEANDPAGDEKDEYNGL